MALSDLLSGALSSAAARVEAVARAIRSPNASTVADARLIPGAVAHPTRTPDARAREILTSWGVYSSRISPLAGPSATRWALWNAADLTPETIVNAQKNAVTSGIALTWVELIDHIFSRDGHYASASNQRVADVVKGTWRLDLASSDTAGIAAANFVDEVYRGCSRWSDGLGWLLFSNLYGFNAVEVEWAREWMTFPGPRGETIGPVEVAVPRRLHNVHPKHFRFDTATDDPLFWIADAYQPLPLGKFVFMDGDGLHPIKLRRGHAWQCIWYSLFRSIGWSGWVTFVERFGMPVPLIEYDGDVAQYTEFQTAYEDILNSLGTGKGAILPRTGASVRHLEAPQGGRSSDPHSALSDACDAAQSIRVLGATLTTKIGNVGSFAASSTHADVKFALEENDARRMWERIDEQLTAPLLLFNAVPIAEALRAAGYSVTPAQFARRVPKGKHHIPGKTDPMQEMQVAQLAVKMGLPLSMSGMFARMDFQRARDDADRIPGESEVVSKGGALIPTSEAAKAGGVVVPDASDGAASDGSESAPQPPTNDSAAPAGSESDVVAHPDESLNGAQVTALLDVIRAVGAGEIPKDAAKQLISSAFPISDERVNGMIDPIVVGSLTPKESPAVGT